MENDKLERILEQKKKEKFSDRDICKTALEISEKIKESINSSSFLMAMDILETGSSVFIVKGRLPESENIEREFIEV